MDGSIVVVGWGRADLGQLATLTPEEEGGGGGGGGVSSAFIARPIELPPLPSPLSPTAGSSSSSSASASASASADMAAGGGGGGGTICEAWCGSEFTAASDRDGFLFMTGWREHGSLGGGQGQGQGQGCFTWMPVRDVAGRQVRLRLSPWAGSLALGGGHCLALV